MNIWKLTRTKTVEKLPRANKFPISFLKEKYGNPIWKCSCNFHTKTDPSWNWFDRFLNGRTCQSSSIIKCICSSVLKILIISIYLRLVCFFQMYIYGNNFSLFVYAKLVDSVVSLEATLLFVNKIVYDNSRKDLCFKMAE